MNVNYFNQAEFAARHPEVDLSQYDTTTISGMIGTASARVDQFCEVDGFEYTQVVGEKTPAIITKVGDLKIWPRRPNVTVVSSITIHRGNYSLALTLTSNGADLLEIPEPKNMILYPYTYLQASGTFSTLDLSYLRHWDLYVILNYTAGYPTLPEAVKQAAMLYFKDMISGRANPLGASSISQGGVSIKFANRDDGKSDAVQDAEQLLQKYVRVVP